jgi:hypothetical protein
MNGKASVRNGYIETSMAEDAVASLETACEFMEKARNDDRYWKWFVLALHAAFKEHLH